MSVKLFKTAQIYKFSKYILNVSDLFPISRCSGFRQVMTTLVSFSKYRPSSYAAPEHGQLNRKDSSLKFYVTNSNQEELIINFIRSEFVPSSKDIELFKYSVIRAGKSVTSDNIDSIVLSACIAHQSIQIGREYFIHMLKNKNTYNIASVGKFFLLCYRCQQFCTEEDKKLIVVLYDELITKYNVLDSITCENALLALSLTDSWKQGLKLIDMCKLSSEPSSKMYNALIVASFKNNDSKLGWTLIENAISNNRQILPEAVIHCIGDKSKQNTVILLKLLEKYNVRISRDSANVLLENHEPASPTPTITPIITTISKHGRCSNCSETLKSVDLSESEFVELKKKFLSPVLVGGNIFLKTKPAELNAFLKFIKDTGKVDVVLDGLNIAYASGTKRGNHQFSFTLLRVVDWFAKIGKRVLIIGRNHMLNWPHKHISIIKKKSYLFLTDDVTADDPYVLYAAMFNGLGTIFVSRDQMRGHKFLLKEPHLREIFSRWQQKHQYYLKYVTADGKVILESPPSYLECIQESAHGRWHIPLLWESEKAGVPGHLLPQITSWLCLP